MSDKGDADPDKPSPEEDVSKGGSRMIRYGGTPESTYGSLEEPTAEFMEERETVYSKFFGEPDSVLHELLPLVPHVDVYRFAPTKERDYFTYATGGMSDLPMQAKAELDRGLLRAELIFYSSEDNEEYPNLLRHLAHWVHDVKTWLHWGHTMPNGQPAVPLFNTKNLDTLFFMPSIVEPDSTLGHHLVLDDDPVHFLWVVPITSAECELKLEAGTDALLDLFEENQHSFVFTGDRESYV